MSTRGFGRVGGAALVKWCTTKSLNRPKQHATTCACCRGWPSPAPVGSAAAETSRAHDPFCGALKDHLESFPPPLLGPSPSAPFVRPRRAPAGVRPRLESEPQQRKHPGAEEGQPGTRNLHSSHPILPKNRAPSH